MVGSEIVGMIPLQPLLMAADYFIEKEGLFVLQEQQKIRFVIERLGLSSISEFKPQEKIIEYVDQHRSTFFHCLLALLLSIDIAFRAMQMGRF